MSTTHFPPRSKRECIRTKIWQEFASTDNPFISQKTLCHGYDFDALLDRYGWTQLLFLVFRGELPTAQEDSYLNLLMSSMINPGPRDAATRAAMNCGIGKTPLATILTTGLTIRGGMAEGSLNVENAMRFLLGQLQAQNSQDSESGDFALTLIRNYERSRIENSEYDIIPLPIDPPGFGLYYGEQDPRAITLLAKIKSRGNIGNYLSLALNLESHLSEERGIFLTQGGVIASALCDLGFSPEQGSGIFLIAGSVGIFAHGIEQLPRKWTEYPFWSDPAYYDYVGPEPKKKVDDPV